MFALIKAKDKKYHNKFLVFETKKLTISKARICKCIESKKKLGRLEVFYDDGAHLHGIAEYLNDKLPAVILNPEIVNNQINDACSARDIAGFISPHAEVEAESAFSNLNILTGTRAEQENAHGKREMGKARLGFFSDHPDKKINVTPVRCTEHIHSQLDSSEVTKIRDKKKPARTQVNQSEKIVKDPVAEAFCNAPSQQIQSDLSSSQKVADIGDEQRTKPDQEEEIDNESIFKDPVTEVSSDTINPIRCFISDTDHARARKQETEEHSLFDEEQSLIIVSNGTSLHSSDGPFHMHPSHILRTVSLESTVSDPPAIAQHSDIIIAMNPMPCIQNIHFERDTSQKFEESEYEHQNILKRRGQNAREETFAIANHANEKSTAITDAFVNADESPEPVTTSSPTQPPLRSDSNSGIDESLNVNTLELLSSDKKEGESIALNNDTRTEKLREVSDIILDKKIETHLLDSSDLKTRIVSSSNEETAGDPPNNKNWNREAEHVNNGSDLQNMTKSTVSDTSIAVNVSLHEVNLRKINIEGTNGSCQEMNRPNDEESQNERNEISALMVDIVESAIPYFLVDDLDTELKSQILGLRTEEEHMKDISLISDSKILCPEKKSCDNNTSLCDNWKITDLSSLPLPEDNKSSSSITKNNNKDNNEKDKQKPSIIEDILTTRPVKIIRFTQVNKERISPSTDKREIESEVGMPDERSELLNIGNMGTKKIIESDEDSDGTASTISELEALNEPNESFSEGNQRIPELARCAYEDSFQSQMDLSFLVEEDEVHTTEGSYENNIPIPTVSDNSADDDDSVKDKDYNIQDEESSSDSEGETESGPSLRERKKLKKSRPESVGNSINRSVDTSIDPALNETNNIEDSIPGGARDDIHMVVENSDCGRRKKNFCFYCAKFQSVISRHLEQVHSNEEDVKEFAILPKKDPQRKNLIEKLRKRGDNKWNTSEDNDGRRLVVRRPHSSRAKPATSFSTCHKCLGKFSAKSFRNHRKICVGVSSKNSRSNVILSKRVAGRVHPAASRIFREVILPVMREDSVVRLMRYDPLWVKFGSYISAKYPKQNQHDLIRARLRLLGRVFYNMKAKNSELIDFASIFDPQQYDDLIESIKCIGGFNEDTGKYATPSNATTAGTYLKKVANYLIVDCIKRGNTEKKKQVKDFLKVHDVEFHVRVSKTALENQINTNRLQKKLLPTTEDIQKLWQYIHNKWNVAYDQICTSFSYEAWLTVGQTTLLMVQIFNRRRAGETERITLADVMATQKMDEKMNPELYKSLSVEERKIVEKYTRLEITGKLNRTVPVILTLEMQESISLLLKYRQNAKVAAQNPFVFALPGYDKGRFRHLKACALLREFSTECGAQFPERLRGTRLRKHIATTCASNRVEESQIYDIANFMGHSEEIHRKVYRQSVAGRDLCSVSKFLRSALGMDFNNVDATSDSSDNSDAENKTTGNQSNRIAASQNVRSSKRTRAIAENDNEGSDDSDLEVGKGEKVVPQKKRKIRWKALDLKIANSVFKDYIRSNTSLPVQVIRDFLKNHPQIQRTEAQIRTWVSNEKKKFLNKK